MPLSKQQKEEQDTWEYTEQTCVHTDLQYDYFVSQNEERTLEWDISVEIQVFCLNICSFLISLVCYSVVVCGYGAEPSVVQKRNRHSFNEEKSIFDTRNIVFKHQKCSVSSWNAFFWKQKKKSYFELFPR